VRVRFLVDPGETYTVLTRRLSRGLLGLRTRLDMPRLEPHSTLLPSPT